MSGLRVKLGGTAGDLFRLIFKLSSLWMRVFLVLVGITQLVEQVRNEIFITYPIGAEPMKRKT